MVQCVVFRICGDTYCGAYDTVLHGVTRHALYSISYNNAAEESLHVEVSEQEQELGFLSVSNFKQAIAVFAACGLVVLRGVYPTDFIDEMHTVQQVVSE